MGDKPTVLDFSPQMPLKYDVFSYIVRDLELVPIRLSDYEEPITGKVKGLTLIDLHLTPLGVHLYFRRAEEGGSAE